MVKEAGGMNLPVNPPVAPMLAKPVDVMPDGDYVFEPKWDGFRSIVFRDGDEVEIGSRNERPMTRYFPELVAAVKAELPERCVIDGAIVIPDGEGRRLPGAQERGGPDRLPAARPVPRRRQAGQRRSDRRVSDGEADRAVHRAPAAGHHVRPAPVELGRAAARPAHAAGGHVQPVEREQGPVVHPAAAGARGRGPLRPYGGPAVPAHGAVRPLAAGPRAPLVHRRPAGGAG